MPKHSTHQKIEKFTVGKIFPKIHRVLDIPSFLGLPKILHDSLTASLIGYHLYGEDGIYSALLHVDLDRLCNEAIRSTLNQTEVAIDYCIPI